MAWQLSGEYMETCNCTIVCPCITSNMAATPTEGACIAAVALHVDKGEKDGVRLDGLSLIVMLHSPGPMAAGGIKVGLIVDEAASQAQVEALRAIASGQAGGPMAALAPLVGEMAGIERRRIRFERQGLTYTVQAGELVDQVCEGLPSMVRPGEAIVIDNVAHPVNTRLALAKALRSVFNVFGLKWNDSTGTRNGHFAPFAWSA